MNFRNSKKDVDWMLEDCMHVYGMNPDEYRNLPAKVYDSLTNIYNEEVIKKQQEEN